MKRYRLQYLHGSLTKTMERTLEPTSDDDYIKVSELREWIKGMREGLNSKSDYQLGKLAILNDLLNGLEGE